MANPNWGYTSSSVPPPSEPPRRPRKPIKWPKLPKLPKFPGLPKLPRFPKMQLPKLGIEKGHIVVIVAMLAASLGVGAVCFYYLGISFIKSLIICCMTGILSGLFTWWMREKRKKRSIQSLPTQGRRRRHWFWRWIICLFKWLLIGLVLFVIFMVTLWFTTPSADDLEAPKYALPSQVFASDGTRIGTFNPEEKREPILTPSDISSNFIKALIATEDRRFMDHYGIDPRAFKRVLMGSGGGSTLTMQTVKLYFNKRHTSPPTWMPRLLGKGYSFVKLVYHKFREMVISVKLESKFSKEEILLIYVNGFDFGSGALGLQSAAQRYFGKDQKDLDIVEAATLVAILNNPNLYHPFKNPDNLLARRNLVLKNCTLDPNPIFDYKKYEILKSRELGVQKTTWSQGNISYFLDAMQKDFDTEVGGGYNLTRDGLQVTTTIDNTIQTIIESETVKYMARKNKDLRVAVMAMETRTGKMLGYLGGHNYELYQYDHVQASRQIGSLNKLFLYTAAVKSGMSMCSIFPNLPYTVSPHGLKGQFESNSSWKPENAGSYTGDETLYAAFRRSDNVVAARVIDSLGPYPLKEIIGALHVTNPDRVPNKAPIALGSYESSLLRMVSAYGAYANEGIYMDPYMISEVHDQNSKKVYEAKNYGKRVLDGELTWAMDSALIYNQKGRVQLAGFPCQIGGKTGTTNEGRDVWFIVLTRDLVLGVTIHYDTGRGTNKLASELALPLAANILKKICNQKSTRHYFSHNFQRYASDVRMNCGETTIDSTDTVVIDEDVAVYYDADEPVIESAPQSTLEEVPAYREENATDEPITVVKKPHTVPREKPSLKRQQTLPVRSANTPKKAPRPEDDPDPTTDW